MAEIPYRCVHCLAVRTYPLSPGEALTAAGRTFVCGHCQETLGVRMRQVADGASMRGRALNVAPTERVRKV